MQFDLHSMLNDVTELNVQGVLLIAACGILNALLGWCQTMIGAWGVRPSWRAAKATGRGIKSLFAAPPPEPIEIGQFCQQLIDSLAMPDQTDWDSKGLVLVCGDSMGIQMIQAAQIVDSSNKVVSSRYSVKLATIDKQDVKELLSEEEWGVFCDNVREAIAWHEKTAKAKADREMAAHRAKATHEASTKLPAYGNTAATIPLAVAAAEAKLRSLPRYKKNDQK